jgi:hypothetical protein
LHPLVRMRRPLVPLASLVALAVVSLPAPVSAQGTAVGAGNPQSSASSRQVVPVFESPLQLSLSPGMISYEGPSGQTESRFLTSVLADWNFSPAGPVPTPIQYGTGVGLLYSHLGAPGSNFFGASSGGASVGGGDGNVFIVPMTVWGGYFVRELGVLASLHTGADLYLRSSIDSMSLGRESGRTGGAVDFFPNLGFRVGWDVRRNFAVSLRTNWTLAPNGAVFLGLLGATIPLG